MVTAINLESERINWRKLELFKKHFFSKCRLGIIFNAACRHVQLLSEKFGNRFFSSITVLTSSLQSCSYVATKNGFIEVSITIMRNHSWNLPPLIKGEEQDLPKIGGGGWQNLLLEKGNKPLKNGVNVVMGGEGVATFYKFTVQFSHIYCVCGK